MQSYIKTYFIVFGGLEQREEAITGLSYRIKILILKKTNMEKEQNLCQICGEPMPEGEGMFMYHGYSGACPKPPLEKQDNIPGREAQIRDLNYNFELTDKCGTRLSREKDSYLRQMLILAERRGVEKYKAEL